MIDKMFNNLKSQPEKVRFAPSTTAEEIAEMKIIESNPTYHWLNSARLLTSKYILLIGGWDDNNVSIENVILPLYRALKNEKAEKVKIEIFNLLGQKIETLVNRQMPAGSHEEEFTSRDLSSGVYLYRIETSEFQDRKKMILLR